MVHPPDRSRPQAANANPAVAGDAIQSSPDDTLRLKDLRVFHDLGRAITSALDRASILQAVMTQMEAFFHSRTWSLLLADDAHQVLRYAIKESISCDDAVSPPMPIGEGMAGWVAARGEPLIVPDASALARSGASVEPPVRIFPGETTALGFRIESAINMPLRSRNRTLGVLQLFNCRLDALTDYAMTFLNILSDYAGIAIENAQVLERIQELTITDDVTRLFNSRHLHTALQAEFERSRRFRSEFSVIFIDLDHFKRINDAHGHLIGTELLVEAAQLIQKTTRSVDSVFRYGGDEFVVLLPQTTKAAAVEAAQRLLHVLRSNVFLQSRGLHLTMTASLGIATYPQDGAAPDAVLQAADTIMYSVKKNDRDNIAVVRSAAVPSPDSPA